MKDKVMQVLYARKEQQDKVLGAGYPLRVATWNLRLSMERTFPGENWNCATLRKVLAELATEGKVEKCKHESRIGQAVWRLL